MNETALASIGILLFFWAVASGSLARRNITGPLVFAGVGYIIANPDWGPVEINVENATIHAIAELTLALVLFSDASRINVSELRHDLSIPVRLLAIALPLSMIAGGALAAALIVGLPWALAAFVGAALAPTDAALSVGVINDDRIPIRLRRALNVESGLNDGLATPIVSVMIAIAASQIGLVTESTGFEAGVAVKEIAIAIAVGLVVGVGGGRLIVFAAGRSMVAEGGRRLAVLALAVSAFEIAIVIDGNGFIAAFVAGIAFGAAIPSGDEDVEHINELPELGGELLALVVWFLFGSAMLPIAFADATWRTVVYALASLTVIRMVPVALSSIGSGLDVPSITFIAWFGPRGLASVVFALLALEELGENSIPVDAAVSAVVVTVLLSVVLHGMSAGPGGRRYVASESASHEPAPRARPGRLVRP